MRTVQGCPFKCIDEYRCEQLPSYQEDLEDLRKENQELQEQVCDVCEDVSPPVAFRIAMSCATVKPQVGLNVWVFFWFQVNQLESVIASMEEDSLTQHQVVRCRMCSASWLRFLRKAPPGRPRLCADQHCTGLLLRICDG
jgi:hypothetical protein